MPVPATRPAPNVEPTGVRQQDSFQATVRTLQRIVGDRGAPPITLGPVTFTAGQEQKLNHLLGRQPAEWYPTDVTGGYGSFQRTNWDDKTISIKSQNACTVTFRVA